MPDSHSPDAVATPREVRLIDYRPPEFLVDKVDLSFELDETATRVSSRMSVRRNPRAAADSTLRLHGAAQPLLRIAIDGTEIGPNRYFLDETGLTIHEVPEAFTLEIETSINPSDNTELSGLYLSGGNFFTQCE